MSFPKRFGRGTRRIPGEMNGLEKKYAAYLDELKHAGDILDYWFDCVKLRLADKTFYTPDFLVMNADTSLEIHETKGHWEDDARVKIKVAADKFPFKFKAIQLVKSQWEIEEL
jgi:hypothetical protein